MGPKVAQTGPAPRELAPAVASLDSPAPPAPPAPPAASGTARRGVVQVAAGGAHSCSLDAGGSVQCWGLGALGQLARQARAAALEPVPVTGLTGVVQLAAGRDVSCALDAEGELRCWGAGPLGDPERAASRVPVVVPELGPVVQVSVSVNHACAVTRQSTVRCWGSNVSGQLGDGALERAREREARGKPRSKAESRADAEAAGRVVEVQGLASVRAVAAGGAHSCALGDDGRVRCWGDNRFGQLGESTQLAQPDQGASEARSFHRVVEGLQDVVQLAAGQFHSCARLRDGGLRCWGRNEAGQLGVSPGDGQRRAAPVEVDLQDVIDVRAGQRHSCALVRGGRVLCWGDNAEGQLGDGSHEDRYRPTPVALEREVVGLSAGERHSCVVLAGGQVRCFGLGDGRLGHGSADASALAVQVRFAAPE